VPNFLADAHLSWATLADIIIVVLLAYEFLRLVRGTRAAQMLVGLGALVIVLIAANRFQLPMLSWLGRHLLAILPFALIVIFQAEIRHLLSKIGRRLWFSPGGAHSETYDDLVLAAASFAQHRIGALMVIEREVGLRTFVESGVPLDARLTYDLLATIFRPETPLHDGAAIIQGDRVAAAACFLPLSMNPILSTQLGTRHRAAIGITEETDAVAIVVSEETGSISITIGGRIERNLSTEALRERLSTLLKRYVPSGGEAPTEATHAESALEQKIKTESPR
jgi:diadenylate cyclase